VQSEVIVLNPLSKGGNREFRQDARLMEKRVQFNQKIWKKKKTAAFADRRRWSYGGQEATAGKGIQETVVRRITKAG
jgi:hypothetical protein